MYLILLYNICSNFFNFCSSYSWITCFKNFEKCSRMNCFFLKVASFANKPNLSLIFIKNHFLLILSLSTYYMIRDLTYFSYGKEVSTEKCFPCLGWCSGCFADSLLYPLNANNSFRYCTFTEFIKVLYKSFKTIEFLHATQCKRFLCQ